MNGGEAIGCATAVLDNVVSQKTLGLIRGEAIGGLLALPRVGMGIGGFLAGTKQGERIQILDRMEIASSHANGPAFLPSPAEIEEARARSSEAAPLDLLGIYISKTRGPLELSDAELELFRALCPETGQIALLIRPSTVEPVKAALFERQEDGSVQLTSAWEMDSSGDLRAIDITPVPAPAPNLRLRSIKFAAAAISEEESAAGTEERVSVEPLVIPEPPLPEPLPEPAPMPLAAVPDPVPAVPLPPPAPSHFGWRHSVLFGEAGRRESWARKFAFASGALALIAAALVLTVRGQWAPPPELKLDVAEDSGGLVFHWNPDAASGADHGRLLVSDGGRLSQFPLESSGLASGSFRYVRKSDQIVVKLVVGDREARAVYFGDAPSPSREGR